MDTVGLGSTPVLEAEEVAAAEGRAVVVGGALWKDSC